MDLFSIYIQNYFVFRDYVGEGMVKEDNENSKSLDFIYEDFRYLIRIYFICIMRFILEIYIIMDSY